MVNSHDYEYFGSQNFTVSSLPADSVPSRFYKISLLLLEDPIMRQLASFQGLLILLKTHPHQISVPINTPNKSQIPVCSIEISFSPACSRKKGLTKQNNYNHFVNFYQMKIRNRYKNGFWGCIPRKEETVKCRDVVKQDMSLVHHIKVYHIDWIREGKVANTLTDLVRNMLVIKIQNAEACLLDKICSHLRIITLSLQNERWITVFYSPYH